MATSPIYNWPEPDNTDLVKNGALAIRTLGNAIDTTMATMVPKTIVDAKGDLIAGTAADTAARLAVGNNGETLVADSSTATGLKWASATTQYPWQSWTPTWGALTVGNGTTVARYVQIGKTVHWYLKFTLGTTSAVTAPYFTLPVTAATPDNQAIPMMMRDAGVAFYYGMGIQEGSIVYTNAMLTNGTYAQPTISSTAPFTWGSTDFFTAQGSYEAA